MDSARLLSSALKRHQSGDIVGAIAVYRRLVEHSPDDPQLNFYLGTAEAQTGDWSGAIRHLQHSLKFAPDNFNAYSNLGTALQNSGRLDDALSCLDRAIAIRPDFADAHSNRGIVLSGLGRLKEALQCFGRAIALDPGFVAAHVGQGDALRGLGKYDEALQCYERALLRDPDNADTHNRRAVALRAAGRLQEALKGLDRAIELRPDFADAYTNRGNVFKELNRLEDALDNYDRAIEIRPGVADSYVNRGVTLTELGRLDEALRTFDHAIRLKPDQAEAYWNKALALLLKGDFAQGWELFEWRWKSAIELGLRIDPSSPKWSGEDIRGKTILVQSEQGLGDVIQFCRYLPMMEKLGARVVVEVPAPLSALISSLRCDLIVVERGQPLPVHDLHCPIMSLPRAFGTTLETIPNDVPYLFVDSEKRARWRKALGERSRLRVGLVWSGSTTHKNDRNRSLTLDALRSLLDMPIEFHSLQKEYRDEDRILLANEPRLLDHHSELIDLSDTAALVSELDLVVSVDTAVAHLAGALGVPIWILLPKAPDFRWMLHRTDTPWYPTARLFRQPSIGDWETPKREVSNSLQDLLGEP